MRGGWPSKPGSCLPVSHSNCFVHPRHYTSPACVDSAAAVAPLLPAAPLLTAYTQAQMLVPCVAARDMHIPISSLSLSTLFGKLIKIVCDNVCLRQKHTAYVISYISVCKTAGLTRGGQPSRSSPAQQPAAGVASNQACLQMLAWQWQAPQQTCRHHKQVVRLLVCIQ